MPRKSAEEYREPRNEEYEEEQDDENPHVLAFRQEAERLDHRMYERLEDDPDLADGTWEMGDIRSLCGLLLESIDNTMGKEPSEERGEAAEAATRMLFQTLAENTETGKHFLVTRADRIGDSEKQEMLGYLAQEQKAFQKFLADGQMEERQALEGMHEAIDNGITINLGDIEIAREVHNPDTQE